MKIRKGNKIMEKKVAVDILEDIKQSIIDDDSGVKALNTLEIYRKNLEISVNPKIRKLVDEQKEIISKYGEDDIHTVKINNKIHRHYKS